ncbi:MAG: phosphatase PAP2 family protein [Nitrospiraceae bacterium]|nr:phosphatase PAP2 family protein [Nitrospiraceae bacterium]
MRSNMNAVDRLSLAFTVGLALLVMLFRGSLPHAGWLLLRYGLLAAALAAASVPAGRGQSRTSSWLHALLPVAVVPVIFDSLGDLIPWIHARRYDDLLIAADRLLFFGRHPTVLLEGIISPPLTAALQIAYVSYYGMAVALGIVLLAKNRRREFDEAVFGIVLCFYLSYIGYLLVPAVGPRYTLAGLQTADLAAASWVSAIRNALDGLENTKTDAFPSGHTAVAVMTLYYAVKFREKGLTALLIPCVAGLVFSTVYLRYHYVIDVLAGAALTGLTVWIAPRAKRWFSAH